MTSVEIFELELRREIAELRAKILRLEESLIRGPDLSVQPPGRIVRVLYPKTKRSELRLDPSLETPIRVGDVDGKPDKVR